MARSTPRKNGLEAWRKLLQTLEPTERGRSLGLLNQLLSKSYWTSTKDFQSKLQDWEEAVRDYEKTSGRPFGEEFKVATTLKYGPPEIRTHLLMRVTDRTTYEELRGLVMDYLRANQAWSTPQDDGDAMDVSLVKGKGKFERGVQQLREERPQEHGLLGQMRRQGR